MEELNNIQKVFKFEEVNFNYINNEMEGLFKELKYNNPNESYINEKIENCINFFGSVMTNFKRVNNKESKKLFLNFLKNMRG